jgi:hypothetical protein
MTNWKRLKRAIRARQAGIAIKLRILIGISSKKERKRSQKWMRKITKIFRKSKTISERWSMKKIPRRFSLSRQTNSRLPSKS